MGGADYLGEPMRVAPATAADAEDWTAMRTALWPRGGDGQHAADIARLLVDAGETINLIARDAEGVALGFAEAALRHDYVNGCKTSPVAFLEGIFVEAEARGRGVARALVEGVGPGRRSGAAPSLRRTAPSTTKRASACMRHWVLPRPSGWSISAR